MAIAFVNRQALNSTSSITTLANTAMSFTAANLAWCWVNLQSAGTVAITDTAGNTWIPIGTPLSGVGGAGGNILWQFYAKNLIANASNVVRATWTGASGFTSIGCRQFSGCDTVAPLLNSNQAKASSGATASTGVITFTAQNAVICAGMEGDAPSWSGGTGYTLNTIPDGVAGFTADEYHIVAAQEAATATMAGGSSFWGIVGAAFKEQSLGKIPQPLFRSMAV